MFQRHRLRARKRALRARDTCRATRDTSAGRDRPASAAASSPTRGCDTGRSCGATGGPGRGGDTIQAASAGNADGPSAAAGKQRTSAHIISRRVKIYTKTGDSGETSLFDKTRVSKADARVEAYGEVDEVNA